MNLAFFLLLWRDDAAVYLKLTTTNPIDILGYFIVT